MYAIATNAYLMLYPKEPLQQAILANSGSVYKIWELLKTIGKNEIEDEGRIYGGGLKKILRNTINIKNAYSYGDEK